MRFLSLVCVLLFFPTIANAEGQWREIPKHLIGDVKESFGWPALSIAASTAAGTLLVHEYADADWQVAKSREMMGSASNPISYIGEFGALGLPAVFFLASRLISEGNPTRDYTTGTAEELIESLFFTIGTTGVLKLAVNRTRPLGGNQSFPSAHTALAFSAAGTIAYRYPWYVGVPALGFASVVGLSRIDLQQHFASDVGAGAGIGLFFATAVHRFHNTLDAETARWIPAPLMAPGTVGLSWAGNF